MSIDEELDYLIKELMKENKEYKNIVIPPDIENKKELFRFLVNVRPPQKISDDFLEIQNKFLKNEIQKKGIVSIDDLKESKKNIYIWKGDITTLKCDAIVNAANSRLLGCFVPSHKCIDNAIHTFSGVQLRYEMGEIMRDQARDEETGVAKISKAYNLPSKYIMHTVGPIIRGELTKKDCDLLESCYLSCLKLAKEYNLKSIAFPSISTGEFHFPKEEAAKIAINTVINWLKEEDIKVIFDVFSKEDYEIYKRNL